jgi:hypothetical protein
MAKLLSQRTKKDLIVTIHPRAEDAYNFFLSQSQLFDKHRLGLTSLVGLLDGQIFSAIHGHANQYQLISGFNVIGFALNQFDFEHHQIIIYEEMSDTDIEIHAWKCVFRTLLTSMSNHQLEVFRRSLNQRTPSHIIEQVFSYKSLTQRRLSAITGISVSGLKKQHSLNKNLVFSDDNHHTFKDQKIIFERLINEIQNESR